MILFVSPFFAPELISTGKYNAALVDALVARGERIRVLTGYPTYPDWKPKPCEDSFEGPEVVRGGLFLRYPKSPLLRRAILEIWFFLYVGGHFWKWRREVRRIVCVLPPSLFVFALAWLAPKDVQLVSVIHDLQGVHAAAGGRFRRTIAYFLNRLESAVFARMDRMIFLSESMKRAGVEIYHADESSSRVCYPFVTLSDKAEDPGVVSLFPPDSIHVVYAGALGEKQNPKQLHKFMELLSECDSNVTCHIFSGGPAFDSLRQAAADSRNSRLQFHDLVAEEALPTLYRCSDIQIIPQASGTGDGSLPSKLPNLVAAGCWVFAICDRDSELAGLVERTECGSVCSSWDRDEMMKAAKSSLEAMNGKLRTERAEKGKAWAELLFSRERVVDAVLGIDPAE